MADTDLDTIFNELKDILEAYERHLVTVRDTPDEYYLDTKHIMKNKKPLFFGSVKIGKRYVSFHLMPVYLYPELLDGASDELKRRMQGKSCFNFKEPDLQLKRELAALTKTGFRRYQKDGYVS